MYEKAREELDRTKNELFKFVNVVSLKEDLTNYDVIKFRSLSKYYDDAYDRLEHLVNINGPEKA